MRTKSSHGQSAQKRKPHPLDKEWEEILSRDHVWGKKAVLEAMELDKGKPGRKPAAE
jgi:hypothetical protein